MRSDLVRGGRIDKIEFWLDEQDNTKTGWYINSYDKFGESPVDCVGPYETKTAALRMWHSTTPKEKENARHEDED